MNPFDIIEGYKTYISAVGLAGLGVYQLSQGDFTLAVQSFMGSLAAFGVKSALNRNEVAFLQMKKANEAMFLQMKQSHENVLAQLKVTNTNRGG